MSAVMRPTSASPTPQAAAITQVVPVAYGGSPGSTESWARADRSSGRET